MMDGVYIVVYVLALIAGLGLLTLQNWARRMTLIISTFWALLWLLFELVYLLDDVQGFLRSLFEPGTLMVLTAIGYCGAAWRYLLRPSVKAQFISKPANR